MYFFVLLMIYLVTEGYTLVFAAEQIGWLGALALIFFVSMGGAYLVRRQGAQALVRMQALLARNESPGTELLEGALIFAAGLLLFLPGFLTDLAGLALLIPPLRKTFGPWLLAYLKSRVKDGRYIKTYTVYDCEWRNSWSERGESDGVIDVASRRTPGTGPGTDEHGESDLVRTVKDRGADV